MAEHDWQLAEVQRAWWADGSRVSAWVWRCVPRWLMLIQPFRWLLFVKVREER